MTRLGVVALALLAACNSSPPSSQYPPTSLDLTAAMRQVQFAWRLEEGVWTSKHAAWSASYEEGGIAFNLAPGATFRLGMAELTRIESRLGSAEPRVSGSSKAGLVVERGAVVEEYESSESGVEQRWRFSEKPPGKGALVVRLPVREGRFVSASAGGLDFQAEAWSVRYGHGTWVDAAGSRTQVPARFLRGAILLEVPEAVLGASQFPAVLDPMISSEFRVAQTAGTSSFGEREPALTWSGTHFLAVWNEASGVRGTRLTPAGVVLDPAGIAIAGPTSEQPSVAWDGSNFLVVWASGGARVSSSGTVLDTTPIAIGAGSHPSVASDGANSLVVWVSNADILGARISSAGVVLDSTPIAISTAAGTQSMPTVSWGGTNYLVAWKDSLTSSVLGARVDSAGMLLDPAGFVLGSSTNGGARPGLASDGTNQLVVWECALPPTGGICALRVSPDGTVLDTPFLVSTLTRDGTHGTYYSSVAWDGTSFVVVWPQRMPGLQTGIDMIAARVNPNGVVTDEFFVSTEYSQKFLPAIAAGSGVTMIAWHDDARLAFGASPTIYGARLDLTGVVAAADIRIATRLPRQAAPAVAGDGSSFLLVWQDYRAGTPAIYAATVTASGLTEPAGLILSAASGFRGTPAVARSDGGYLVAWADARSMTSTDIFAALLELDGRLSDAGIFAVASGPADQGGPAVASNGTDYLVVWQDESADAGSNLRGARVSAAGGALDPAGIDISIGGGRQSAPALIWNGSQYLAAWEDTRNGTTDVFAVFLGPTGTIGTEFQVSVSAGQHRSPTVSWDGENHLVAWAEASNGWAHRIMATRVSTLGTLVDTPAIAVGPPLVSFQNQVAPVAAWTGRHHLLLTSAASPSGYADVLAMRLDTTGILVDTTPLLLTPWAGEDGAPSLACGQRRCLFAWEGWGNGDMRVSARLLTENETDPTAASAAFETSEDTPLTLVLAGADLDGDALTYSLAAPPAHGTVSGTAPNLVYLPQPNYFGTDRFTFRVNDGLADSAEASIDLTIVPVNDPPVADAQGVSTPIDTPVDILLTGMDPDGDALFFSVIDMPAHGALSRTDSPALTWTPEPGFLGNDSFTFLVGDRNSSSELATVTLEVFGTPRPHPVPEPETPDTDPPPSLPTSRGCAVLPAHLPLLALAFLLLRRRTAA